MTYAKNYDNALVPQLLRAKGVSRVYDMLIVVGGAVLVALLAQVKIMLPFTPVPITGQTFGVTLVALFLGSKRGGSSLALYLIMGAVGLPVFAGGVSGVWAPTAGYRFGMLGAAFLIGRLADRGWATSFTKAWLAGILGSVIIFAAGLAVLALFIPSQGLLAAGLLPFIPGDLIKTFLAASIVSGTQKFYSAK